MNKRQELKIDYAKVKELPPKFDRSELETELTSAHASIGELRGLLGALPNEDADLLIAPFKKREAITSSRIEGTNASLEEVLRYKAVDEKEDVVEEKTPEQIRNKKIEDIVEIINYESATERAMNLLEKQAIGENLLKSTHKILLRSVRGDDKDRGNFRKKPVRVGEYIPPAHIEIPKLMHNWENYLNTIDYEKDALIRVGVAHYQFEAIHPFQDGNGRIGRLVIPLFLCQENVLPKPALYVSDYFDKNKDDYTRLLHKIDTDQEWVPWLRFFLKAMEVQARETISVAKEMQIMYQRLKKLVMIESKSPHGVAMLDLLFNQPVISAKNIQKGLTAKSRGTSYALIKQFVEMGILEETVSFGREKLYMFRELFDLVNR